MQKVKEHYVPQFYLNGLLHIYDLRQKKFYTQKPQNICFEKNLYETKWESANPKLGEYILPNDIENIFCEYEGEFVSLLKTIKAVCTIDQNSNALILHDKEKEVLCRFAVNLMLRNPISINTLALSEIPEKEKNSDGMSLFKNIMNEMGLGGAESVYLAAQKKAMLTYEFENSFPQVFVENLRKKNFTFYYAQDSEFITSNIPICYGDDYTILEGDKTCLYFPLSPKVIVLFGNYNVPQMNNNRMVKIKSEIVDSFNQQILKLNKDIHMLIGTSRELIEKYV